ncbi:hypothetical protein B0I35DRAFT_270816 [Stachybotrys elegans]|uniref:Uncharacterized protein n=1 Tax=Stachybotrys elegans TaxID=80388 RepID=A0A8K0SN06_9HYPO|nr:hypothetical protein B0I35DRAFT_270816 [Stachybotrys elegans]
MSVSLQGREAGLFCLLPASSQTFTFPLDQASHGWHACSSSSGATQSWGTRSGQFALASVPSPAASLPCHVSHARHRSAYLRQWSIRPRVFSSGCGCVNIASHQIQSLATWLGLAVDKECRGVSCCRQMWPVSLGSATPKGLSNYTRPKIHLISVPRRYPTGWPFHPFLVVGRTEHLRTSSPNGRQLSLHTSPSPMRCEKASSFYSLFFSLNSELMA